MNVETIRNRLSTQLRKHFPGLNEVTMALVSPVNLTGPLLRSEIIYCYEFIINNSERYLTFAVERDGVVYFTRPKEGIRKELSLMIRNRDFSLRLTEDVLNHQDVVGKFIESKLNHNARITIENLATDLTDTLSVNLGEPVHVCHGFKVTQYHKQIMSYDLIVELLAKRNSQSRFERFNIEMLAGKINRVTDSDNKVVEFSDILQGA